MSLWVFLVLFDITETEIKQNKLQFITLYMSVYAQEKQRMTDKLEDTSLRLKDEMDLYRKMMDKLRQNRHQFQKEKEAMQEVGGIILCSQTLINTHNQSCFSLYCSLCYLFLFHSLLFLTAVMSADTLTHIKHCTYII